MRKWLAFKYDYSGRRVEKAVYDLDNNPTVTVLARRFVYDGWNLVAELDGDGSAIQRSYTWGLDVAGGAAATSNPGALLQITNYSSGAPGSSYYPTYDAQGNVASLIKASDGSVAAVYEYDPFGNLIRSETKAGAEEVADNPFRFSTKYHDLETGLVYYGYRYYDPKNGRFINRDPIEESGGNNLYGFCGNNGVNASDLLGMDYEITGTDSTGTMYFRGTPDASWAPYSFRGVQLGYQDASGQRYNFDYGPQIEFDWYNFNELLPGVMDFDVAFEQAFGDMRALAMADMDMADALNAIDRANEVIGHMSDGTPVTRGQGDAWEENNEALYAAAGAEMQYGSTAPVIVSNAGGDNSDIGNRFYIVEPNAKGIPVARPATLAEIRQFAKERGTLKVFENGQSNKLEKATDLGAEQLGTTTFVLHHNPTHTGFIDTLESLWGKLTGSTPASGTLANFLAATRDLNVRLVVHSQGGISANNAISDVVDRFGQNSLSNMAIHYNGAAVHKQTSMDLVATSGARFNGFTMNDKDPVPVLAGGNFSNPLQVIKALYYLPRTIRGEKAGSTHTHYGSVNFGDSGP